MLAWYGARASFPPPLAQPHQSQGEWSPCTNDGPQHELPGLAGRHHVFQNDPSWNIGSLPRLSFPLLPVLLSHPSKHLTILLVLPTPLTAGSNLPQPVQSHICLMGYPTRGAPPAPLTTASFPVSLFLPPLSQPQALCYQALSFCPTLVNQKSGPFSQPWMSKSMHLEQATALGAKESGMHDELWNPFPDKFRISGSARALDQWMGTCVTNQKILLGKCLGGKICSLLLWQTEGLMKILQGWPENKPLLIYVLNLGIA